MQSISLQLDVSNLGKPSADSVIADQSDSAEMRNQATMKEFTSVEGLIVTKEDVLRNSLHDESQLPPDLELQREIDPADDDNTDVQQEQLHNHKTIDGSVETPITDVAGHSLDMVNSSHTDNLSTWGCVFVLENCLTCMDRWINILIDNVSFIVFFVFFSL